MSVMTASRPAHRFRFVAQVQKLTKIDLRSLALFRIGLGLLIIVDLINRSRYLRVHYTDSGLLPRSELIETSLDPIYWSIHLSSGQLFVQAFFFLLAGVTALALLIGYRSRFASLLSWVLLVSLHNRNPLILDSGDDALRLLLFWSLLLPVGAYYSIDSALNLAEEKLPTGVSSGATLALTLQICFLHWFSAISAIGDARSPSISVITWIYLLAPIFLFIPFYSAFFRLGVATLMVLLHVGLGLSGAGLFAWVMGIAWLALIPSSVWIYLSHRSDTPERRCLQIYYDGECGFCKKVVYLIRTFLILPNASISKAQENASIFADMEAYNSWVVVDYTHRRRMKFEAIAYVCRVSLLFHFLAPLLEWKPLMARGNRLYEAIASNRKTASAFSRWMKFHPVVIRPRRWHHLCNAIALFLITYIILWNLIRLFGSSFKPSAAVHQIGLFMRLDQ